MSTPTIARTDFPPDFLWGCATSSYQIEGGQTDGRVASIWDTFAAQPGAIRDGSDGRIACDHYHRWPQDLDLARDLGMNAYRFSIAWPRIFSGAAGRPNEKGLDFYSRLVDGMLERGLQPWATLYHWDLPQALQDAGGWPARATVDAYLEFTDAISRKLGDRVKHWITHNEPWCSAIIGYHEGVHAPGQRDLTAALQAAHHILLSHGKAIPLLRANVRDAQVGITLSLHPAQAATGSAEDRAAAERHDGLRYNWFLDPLYGRGYPEATSKLLADYLPDVQAGDLEAIAAPVDFLGVNYYFPEVIAAAPGEGPLEARVVHPEGRERTAMGWEVAPDGLRELLMRIVKDYAPARLLVTENGACYDDVTGPDGAIHDDQRTAYFVQHLAALRAAIQAGAPVEGYFAWSLMDNFEWAEGYLRRFGLVHVDFGTQERRVKDSGLWFRRFLRGG